MAVFLTCGLPMAQAEEFHCEVLSIEGTVTVTDIEGEEKPLQEGDLLSPGDTVSAGEASSADIAFDNEWKNVTHVEEKSKMKIAAISPAQVLLKEGGVFAKLQQLPKNSSFEVKTPTAIATVRGTEYRTTFTEGQTQVYNVSPSKVYVYSIQDDGSVNRDRPVVLEQSTKTQVDKVGELPSEPQEMTTEESTFTETVTQKIETRIQTVVSSGRVSKIQSVADIQEAIASAKKKPSAGDSDLSRVVDARRRPFKKAGE